MDGLSAGSFVSVILFSHPTGNANVRQAALPLPESGVLFDFRTTIGWNAGHPLPRFLPSSLQRELLRRHVPPELRPRTRSVPGREIGRHAAAHLGLSRLTRHEFGICSVDAVY